MTKVYENVGKGLELGKRTYLGGVVYEHECSKCGTKLKRDFGDDYLSHPEVGVSEKFSIYCYKCDDEDVIGKIKVELKVTIEDNKS